MEIVTAGMDRPVKVIAGAGTGKTETLTRRFLWLVQEKGCDPARILAVTFTEKAAAEMKARIRAALTKAGREPEAPLCVHTFHGFARTVLTEHCYRLGLPPRPKMLSDVRQRVFLDRLFHRLCDGEVTTSALSPEILAELAPSSLAGLQDAFQRVLYTAKGKGWSPDEFHDRAMELEQRFYRALPDPADAWACGSTPKGALCATIRDALAGGFPCVEADDSPDVRKLYFLDLRKGEPRADIGDALRDQRDTTRRFIEAARDFYRLYEEERAAEGALDFDDLVNTAVALLREPDVRDRFRQRFEYVLVDEFQDTSPMQMELVCAVCRSAPREPSCPMCPDEVPANLTIVGDKKQAIYAWRNARRENMDDILPCPDHARVVNLTRNYRSRPEILALANAIREGIEPGDPDTWTEKTEAARIHAADPFVGEHKADARRAEAGYVAECIQHLVQEDETRRYGQIAVLVRKNSHFAELRRAFRERGIPYVREGATGLLEEPTCKDVLAYLSVLARPLDDYSMVRVLKRPPVGISDRDLVRMRYPREELERVGRGARPELPYFLPGVVSPDDDRLEGEARASLAALARRLERLAELQNALPVRALLERLSQEAGLWDAWGPDDRAAWPNTLGTLQSIADALEEDQAGLDVPGFLEAIDLYSRDSRLAAPAAESAMDGVCVLTVHQAKGLEYPIVFLVGMGETPRSESGWTWDDAWGVIPALPEGSAKSAIAKWLRPRKEERADEEARCWYVAATRPKDALIVTCVEDQHGRAVRPPEIPDYATDTEPMVPPGACTVNVSRPEPVAPSVVTPVPVPAPGPFSASFSAIEAMERCPVGLWIDRHWRLPDAARSGEGSAGMRVGTLVHEAIAAHFAGPDGASALEARFTPEDTEDVRSRARALWSAFQDWSGPSPVEVERFVRLTVPTPLGDVLLSGYVDALVPNGAGLEVVDYKTNRELPPERLHAYALQMAIYRKALLADGLSVSTTGRLVHIRAGGCEVHALDLAADGLNDRLQRACEDVAALLAGPSMPEPPDGRICRYCGHGDICPHVVDGAARPGAGLVG